MSAQTPNSTTIFITHESEHVSLASAIVDLLEESIAGAEGRIGCSDLPGYPSDLSRVLSYRRDLRSPTSPRSLVIGLPAGQRDSRVVQDLRAAREADVQIILLADIGAGHKHDERFAGATRLTMDVAGLTALVEDAAYSLRVRPRFSPGAREALSAVVEAAATLGPAVLADAGDPAAFTPVRPMPAVMRASAPGPEALEPTEVQAAPGRAAWLAEQSFAQAEARSGRRTGADGDGARVKSQPPPLPTASRAPASSPPVAPMQSQTVPRQGLTASHCVEAGVDLCDCLFGELDRPTATLKLRSHFAPFFEAIGGDFERLARFAGEDGDWQAAVDDRVEALPPDRAWLGQWYMAGYQLAILCNLASLPPGSAPEDVTTEAWGDFCAAAMAVGMSNDMLSDVRVALHFPEGERSAQEARAQCLQYLRYHAQRDDDARGAAREDSATLTAG